MPHIETIQAIDYHAAIRLHDNTSAIYRANINTDGPEITIWREVRSMSRREMMEFEDIEELREAVQFLDQVIIDIDKRGHWKKAKDA